MAPEPNFPRDPVDRPKAVRLGGMTALADPPAVLPARLSAVGVRFECGGDGRLFRLVTPDLASPFNRFVIRRQMGRHALSSFLRNGRLYMGATSLRDRTAARPAARRL